MRSFTHKADNRRQVYLALAGSIESQLREAYAKRFEAGQETQTTLAEKLGVNRSVVNRRLTGRQKNLTVETVADMVWALGNCVSVRIYDPRETQTNAHQIVPTHPAPKEARTSKQASVAYEAKTPIIQSSVKKAANMLVSAGT